MQGSPFYPKNNPNFALSMTEKKTPLGFKGDYDAMKNQRAFTPLLD